MGNRVIDKHYGGDVFCALVCDAVAEMRQGACDVSPDVVALVRGPFDSAGVERVRQAFNLVYCLDLGADDPLIDKLKNLNAALVFAVGDYKRRIEVYEADREFSLLVREDGLRHDGVIVQEVK